MFKVEDYGLRPIEGEELVRLLGREPNDLEARIMSVMWSEHCSYKSTLHLLKKLPKEGPYVVAGAGENAGVVDGGDGWGLAFKVESHNHPSAVAPVQGAATGVGGIIRDILAMGARPVANLDGLFFGGTDTSIEEGIIRGVGGYGNCVGVPTVGGCTVYDPTYQGNPLVNAFTLGTVRLDQMVSSQTAEPGQLVALLGSATGRDGIAGASFASGDLIADESDKLSIQIGDPFAEKKLIECCLEMNEKRIFVAMQDMGAAGILSSSSEVAAKSGVGMTIDFSAVPLRAKDMQPWEIALSETQERMLLILRPEQLAQAQELANHHEVPLTVIGKVEEGDHYRITWEGQVVADMPASAVGADCPPARWPLEERPAYEGRPESPLPEDMLEQLLRSPNGGDKSWLYGTYDSQVGYSTVKGPGGPVSLVRYGKDRLAALVMEADPWACELSPKEGTAQVVAASLRALNAAGAEPMGLTNCLNFPSPEMPTQAWVLAQSVEGLAESCRELGCPVVSGNVSLYNQTPKGAIYPTPLVVVVGAIPSADLRCDDAGWQDGDLLLALGSMTGRLEGSLATRLLGEPLAGSVASPNYEKERALNKALRLIARSGKAHCARALGRGGLARTLAEMALASGVGVRVTEPLSPQELYGDFAPGALFACRKDDLPFIQALAEGVSLKTLGHIGGKELVLNDKTYNLSQLDELRKSENVRRGRHL